MKLSTNIVRKGVIAKLKNNITYDGSIVPVYGNIPNNATYPYIKVSTPQMNETDFNNGSFMSTVNVVVDVVTRYKSDIGGFGASDNISNLVTQILRTRSTGYIDLNSDGFDVYRQVVTFVNQIQQEANDNYYYRTITNLDITVQEVGDLNGLQNNLQSLLQS